MKPPRITRNVLKVLDVFLDRYDEPKYGFALAKATRLATGTLYPILDRLEESGVIRGEWENIDPIAEGRPARYNLRLTLEGIKLAERELHKNQSPVTGVAGARHA